MSAEGETKRFRDVFLRLHGEHRRCIDDEWLSEPCRDRDGRVLDRPIVWSRRNGPWRRVETVWVGAAPGNAGGRGTGEMGAHGTRIPFGGDVAGANLEVLLGSSGLTRNDVFIVAALNQLPAQGGGEPRSAEILAPIGGYGNSVAVLKDTIVAAAPELIVALGNVAARVVAAAWSSPTHAGRLPGLARLRSAGWPRQRAVRLRSVLEPDATLERSWRTAWSEPPDPSAIWIVHPSAQNMSPFAGAETAFHARMVEACAALRSAVEGTLGRRPPEVRADSPASGIYALPEWRERVAPWNQRLDRLWREKGL